MMPEGRYIYLGMLLLGCPILGIIFSGGLAFKFNRLQQGLLSGGANLLAYAIVAVLIPIELKHYWVAAIPLILIPILSILWMHREMKRVGPRETPVASFQDLRG